MINIIKTAKQGLDVPNETPSPQLHYSNEDGVYKNVDKAGDKPTNVIQLSLTDKLSKDFRGFHCINGNTYYNPKYYQIIKPSDTVKQELKQLTNTDRLKKKLLTHFRNLDRLRYLTGDDRIRKLMNITKAKKTIQKYLTELRADPKFQLTKSENAIYLVYMGDYARTRRAVVI